MFGLRQPAGKVVRSVLVGLYFLGTPLALLAGLELYLKHRKSEAPVAVKGVERAVRLREHPPGSVLIEEPDPAFLRASAQNVEPKRYLLRIDRDGFIMPSRRHDEPDITLVFLGGSTTECVLVEEDLRFPALAGELLARKSGLKVNAFNGGKSGNNSLHSINVLLNKVIPLDPQVVVMMHNINDLVVLLLERSYWNAHPRRSPVFTVRNARMSDLVRAKLDAWIPHTMRTIAAFSSGGPAVRGREDEFAHKRGRSIPVDRDAMLREFEMNLNTFIALCRARRITPVLMTQAHRMTDDPDAFIAGLMEPMERDYGIASNAFKALYDAFNDRIRAVGRKQGVLVIDLDRRIPKTGEYLYDLVHFHDKGSAYAADIISSELLPLVARRIQQ